MRYQLATLGIWELLIILLIVVVIFGAGRLPQLGDAMGRAIRNFRQAFKGEAKEIEGESRRIEQLPGSAGLQSDKQPAEKVQSREEENK